MDRSDWSYEEQFEAVFLDDAADDVIIKWLKNNQFTNDLIYPNFSNLRGEYESVWASKSRALKAAVAAYGCEPDVLEALYNDDDFFITRTVLRNPYVGARVNDNPPMVLHRSRVDELVKDENWKVLNNIFWNENLRPAFIGDLFSRSNESYRNLSDERLVMILEILQKAGYIETILNYLGDKDMRFSAYDCLIPIIEFISKFDVKSAVEKSKASSAVVFTPLNVALDAFRKFLMSVADNVAVGRGLSAKIREEDLRKYDVMNYDEAVLENCSGQYVTPKSWMNDIQTLLVPHAVAGSTLLSNETSDILISWRKEKGINQKYHLYYFQNAHRKDILSIVVNGKKKPIKLDDLPAPQELNWENLETDSFNGQEDSVSSYKSGTEKEMACERINLYLQKEAKAFCIGLATNRSMFMEEKARLWLKEMCKKFDFFSLNLPSPLGSGQLEDIYNSKLERLKKAEPDWF